MGSFDSSATEGASPSDTDALGGGATVRGLAAGERVFGRFRLGRLLGRGRWGTVWLVRDEALDRDLALKFLPERLAGDPQALAAFKHALLRTLDLTHPRIVRVYDFFEDGRLGALAMESIAGSSLAERLLVQPQRRFALADVSAWLGQLCAALGYAHTQARLVHGDLKPANLMITLPGDLKITDFGLATVIADSIKRAGDSAAPGGKLVYMSPQQRMGEIPAVTDDIYALGVTLHELLTGQLRLPSGDTTVPVQRAMAVLLDEGSEGRRNMSEPLPPLWEETITACLAEDPAHRPQSIEDVARRLGIGEQRWAKMPGRIWPQTGGAQEQEKRDRGWTAAGSADGSSDPTLPICGRAAEQERAAAVLRAVLPVPRSGVSGSLGLEKRGRRLVLLLALGVLAIVLVQAVRRRGDSLTRKLDHQAGAGYDGTVQFITRPAGALVRFSQKKIQDDVEFLYAGEMLRTPILVTLRPGNCEVVLQRDGYRSVQRTVRVVSGGAAIVDVTLERLAGASSVVAANAPVPGVGYMVPGLGLTLLWMEPGTFTMGDEKFGYGPSPTVTLSRGFWLGRTEVTNAQWSAVMGGGGPGVNGGYPAEKRTYQEVIAFCLRLTEREQKAGRLPPDFEYTLPTEAQWEYACRAGTTGDYAGPVEAMAWYQANSGRQSHPVGQKQPNAWGLYDMHGNVAEWCRDWYGEYPQGAVTDPTGPAAGEDRIYRGGGWSYSASNCRSANRYWGFSGQAEEALGFRLALAPVR